MTESWLTLDNVKWFLLYAWRPFIEIGIIALVLYFICLLVQGTRTAQLIKGLGAILILFFISQKLELLAINWLLTKFFAFSVIAFLILFQPELRRALTKIGQNHLFPHLMRKDSFVEEIVKAITFLSKKRIGALLVIERNNGLANYAESGVMMDAQVSSELLISIFMPTTPLHDGAVILQGERVLAAGCLLPLSDNPVQQRLGTRHRAGMGIAEETDSVVVIVSEETGITSVVIDGKITRDLGAQRLTEILSEVVLEKTSV